MSKFVRMFPKYYSYTGSLTSTAKVLVSCSDIHFETDIQPFELFSNGFEAFKTTRDKLSNKLNLQGTDVEINGIGQGTDITTYRNVQGTDITINGNVQGTDITIERNVQGTDITH